MLAGRVVKCDTVCCYRLLLVLLVLLLADVALANGSESAAALGNNNYLTASEVRARRDVVAQQIEPQPSAATLVSTENADNSDNNSNNNRNQYNVNEKDMQDLPPNIGAYKALHIVKRAPSGFIGMRGKKEYEPTDYSSAADGSSSPDWSAIDPLQQAQLENDYNEAVDWSRYKKTPSAFYGVRGKKYTADNFNHLNSVLYKLEEERLREAVLEDFLNDLAVRTMTQNEITKRAPTGFTGMRGKRPAADVMDMYDDEADLLEEKRGPANAFVGVRGKKDVHHQNFKRSPTESYNRRGKTQRFVDFSNKFVAVRGKKSDTDSSAVSSKDASAELTAEARQLVRPAAATRERLYANMQLLPLLGVRPKRAAVLGSPQAAVNDMSNLSSAPAN